MHVLNRYSLPELIGLAERAWQTLGKLGFTQICTNNNLEYRSVGYGFRDDLRAHHRIPPFLPLSSVSTDL